MENYQFRHDKENFILVILKRGYGAHIDVLSKIAEKTKMKVIGYKVPNAEFLGERVSDHELKRLYSSALFLIYPYDSEYFGYIPIEVMASGTPVLAFKYSGGPSETIIDGKTGWLAYGEKDLYYKAVTIYEQGYNDKFSENCRKRALEFSVESQTKELVQYIRSLHQ
ncbi:glycosyltransferase [Candidatus Acidianus copahuensis]|uniref:glycosyltransferase n=1 Tax=Candidatus Acidianus copahuensis TaxID=1160895 RepID=UPI000A5DF3AA|nr:glycosyltransferase [Candidatus Acidianus copahuensis]